MAGSEAYAPFDVVLVPFPFSDRLAEKRRPAVVVSKSDLQARHGHVWLVMVTSAGREPWESDVPIDDLAAAGLPAPSLVRTAKLTTTESNRIIRRLGRLSPEGAISVRRQIAAQLG
jgi:mRNA interferase MazF